MLLEEVGDDADVEMILQGFDNRLRGQLAIAAAGNNDFVNKFGASDSGKVIYSSQHGGVGMTVAPEESAKHPLILRRCRQMLRDLQSGRSGPDNQHISSREHSGGESF
jgi:hypothetical protein